MSIPSTAAKVPSWGVLAQERREYREKMRAHSAQIEQSSHRPTTMLQSMTYHAKTIWLFTSSDHFTFVLPETMMGVCGLLSTRLIPRGNGLDWSAFIYRLMMILIWNYFNTLIFDLANQGSEIARAEDVFNKPFRPIPAGRISVTQTRNLLFLLIPIFYIMCGQYFGGQTSTGALIGLTWIYNDLGGSDKNFMIRNAIIAAAYFYYGKGSLSVAAEAWNTDPSPFADTWLLITSLVIFTTMSIQDLKDQDGDRFRNRKTAPLVMGDKLSRWIIGIPILLWGPFCAIFWKFSGLYVKVYWVSGAVVAFRTICLRGSSNDRVTWQLWAIWLMLLYAAPIISEMTNSLVA